MSRDIPFEPDLKCDSCGNLGAMDFMGDALCFNCADGGATLAASNIQPSVQEIAATLEPALRAEVARQFYEDVKAEASRVKASGAGWIAGPCDVVIDTVLERWKADEGTRMMPPSQDGPRVLLP